uniref:Reverse transcriptase domain-containing protein n=1 Tax=Xenopus tropicalis TaxID=8364 RepID=A0A803JDF7_XENTR
MYAFETFSLPETFSEATIVVIPKPGKDANLCTSYRPISLLNMEVKILAKVLAKRLAKVVSTLVEPDQTGFMPAKSTHFNLRRLFLNLQLPHENKGSRIIVSLDTAKAFDSIEWPYLWEVITRMGFGPSFVKWLKLLYSAPKAVVKVNGILSTPFHLTRGTRQGCPLSPLLFALAIEPMAIQVRHSQQIKGFIYKTIEEKISLYADDTLLYLADPYNSFDTVLEIIKSFGTFSGLQINWEKSIIFPLDDQVPVMADPECTLKIANTFKYLGITIHKEPAQFFTHNLHPLQNKFEDTLKFWTKLPLTLIGRINICKMIFLPKFLYQFTNTPCHIPKKALLEIDRTQSAFIWGNKSPTLSRSTLNAPQEQLGLASPNYELYYLAAQCAHIANWKV